jgi:hypothetical protein
VSKTGETLEKTFSASGIAGALAGKPRQLAHGPIPNALARLSVHTMCNHDMDGTDLSRPVLSE